MLPRESAFIAEVMPVSIERRRLSKCVPDNKGGGSLTRSKGDYAEKGERGLRCRGRCRWVLPVLCSHLPTGRRGQSK